MNKITAIVDEVKAPEQVTERFTKQEVILRVDPQSEKQKVNYIPIECTNKSVGVFTKTDEGRKVDVGFFVNGRKWQAEGRPERVFVSLRYAEHEFITGGAKEPLPMDDGESSVDDW